MKIGILGGGIIGLCSAYYLNKEGHEVTIIEQGAMLDGCSFGNAGMIVPSHLVPLAAPGMISKGIKWMFNSTSPFYVKPRLSGDLLKWGYYFYKSATKEHVEKSATALKEISLLSKAMYKQMAVALPFDFGYQEKGLLMLYQTKETEHEERETAAMANAHGIEAHILTESEIQKLEPDVKVRARGGVYFPGDAHITPQSFISNLIKYLRGVGVTFQTSTSVEDFIFEQNSIKEVITSNGNFSFEQLLIATGSWSGLLTKKLGISLPMQAGKGYSFTIPEVKNNTRIPSIFLEARVAVTPMGQSLRFGGTMEITGIDHRINMNRVRGIVESIPRYYPEMKIELPKESTVWHGLRPCSPDGLPYIGRTQVKNLILATGHSMMGISLGPASGKLVCELMQHEKTSIDITRFIPERF
jgi:D-amino-acid dehydrogenase